MISIVNSLLTIGMLISGCINTISKKFQNETESKGWHGEVHVFKHPWFQTLIMFTGEFLCIFGFLFQRHSYRKKVAAGLVAKDENQKGGNMDAKVFQPILAIPTILDLLGTTFGGIGLVYCSASVWQMLRGSIIIFTGILSKLFLKRVMLPYRWFSICFTIAGLICVGVCGVLTAKDEGTVRSSESGESSNNVYTTVLGIVLILIGQFVAACQMVVEEKLLKGKNFAPMHIVGLEGIFGIIAMVFIVLPLLMFIPGNQPGFLGYDIYENSIDACIQIGNSVGLICYSLLYLLSIAFYNFFGLSVTKYLTCVHRTLIDACRTIVVWAFELILHACDDRYGESWTRYSWIQVIGFVLLILGTLFYNSIIKFPCFNYDETKVAEKKEGEGEETEKTPLINDTTECNGSLVDHSNVGVKDSINYDQQ